MWNENNTLKRGKHLIMSLPAQRFNTLLWIILSTALILTKIFYIVRNLLHLFPAFCPLSLSTSAYLPSLLNSAFVGLFPFLQWFKDHLPFSRTLNTRSSIASPSCFILLLILTSSKSLGVFPSLFTLINVHPSGTQIWCHSVLLFYRSYGDYD